MMIGSLRKYLFPTSNLGLNETAQDFSYDHGSYPRSRFGQRRMDAVADQSSGPHSG